MQQPAMYVPELRHALEEVLERPDELPWDTWVLLLSDQPWDATTACRVENLDDLPTGVDLPPAAVAAGFAAALDVAAVQDIMANLLQQVSQADFSLRLRAFQHYMEHDAFIDLSSSS